MPASPSPRRSEVRAPEVLAPAGDDQCLEAAVRAGADAVYFGLQGFNARARATNFDLDSLSRTLRHLHAHGVKGYVTLNTLVFDDELESLEAAVRAAALAGVDAVIVQDLGVARLVKAVAPELPLHASTQMTCTDASAVELARELGASRVILARETSLEEIRAIRAATDVELEVFVHGALCVAYSGQCLTSEAIGGRSANRGACAQACRLPYELIVDGRKVDLQDRAYLLSPQDLEASALVPDLAALGIASLKIEGRLKGPAYVAATTRLYRAAVDALVGPPVDPGLRARALQTFTRGSGPGFLEGVDHQRLVEARGCDHRGLEVGTSLGVVEGRGRFELAVALRAPLARGDGVLLEGGLAGEGELGGRVWAITERGRDVERADAGAKVEVWLGPDRAAARVVPGRRLFKTSDPHAEKAILREVERDPRRTPIEVVVSGELGAPPRFSAQTPEGRTVSVLGDAPLAPARSSGRLAEVLEEKLGRLGDTPFVLAGLDVQVAPSTMLPTSSINRARRELVDALLEASHRAHPLSSESVASLLDRPRLAVPSVRAAEGGPAAALPSGLIVLARTLDQAEAAIAAGADGLVLDFLDLEGLKDAVERVRAQRAIHLCLAPPRIRKPGEAKIDRFLESLQPDAILVRSLGALHDGARALEAPEGPPRETPARIGDFSLNVTNRLAAGEVLERGLAAFTPAFDLDAAQLLALLGQGLAARAEVVLHHPMPLFHMEHCVFAALLSKGKDYRDCGRPCDRHAVSLRDRAGMDHPVAADVGCRNTVFHAAPQSAAGLVERLRALGVRRFRLELVREDASEVRRLVETYRALLAGSVSASEVWRTLKTESGYGVVRGSLRVLASSAS